MTASAKQRADPLVPLPGLLADLGIPAHEVFAGSGLGPEDLAPGRVVDFDAALTVLDAAAARSGREDFGLMLGLRHRTAVLGPVAEVVRRAATLGAALSDLASLQAGNSSGAAVYLHRQRDQLFCGYGVHDPALPVTPVLHDVVVAVGYRLVTDLTRGAVRPREYLSMRPPPAAPDPWSVLGAPVRFGEAETGFFLAPSDFACPLPTADRPGRDAALRTILAAPALVPAEWTHRTRSALRRLLLEGRSGMPEVAETLGVGVRTLRRALAREATTFEAERDSVRLAIAKELLSMSGLSVGDLALTLDFSTPSAFVHAFRRWTGATPSAWRAANPRRGGG